MVDWLGIAVLNCRRAVEKREGRVVCPRGTEGMLTSGSLGSGGSGNGNASGNDGTDTESVGLSGVRVGILDASRWKGSGRGTSVKSKRS